MTEPRAVALETIVRSNEKLLKALITLLSLKDEHLLDELRTVFSTAASTNPAIGAGDPKVMNEIRRELALVEALVDRINLMPDDDDEEEGGPGVGAPN